ncbi:MAG: VWA domain-containing protein [Terracidiphilus sp.]
MAFGRQGSGIGILAAAFGAALAACLLSVGVKAARQLTPAPVPTLTVITREVLLNVVVTGPDGQPVRGLKASDFTIDEGGAPQTIRTLTEHSPISAADVAKMEAAPVLPPNTFSNYTPEVNRNSCTVLLLDALDTPVASQMYLREQVINYLKHMEPGPSIAIFQLDTEMHLIQGFTTDPKALLAAAESKRNMPSMARPVRGSPYYTYESRIGILRAGMQSIGRYVAAFPGRKNLIWFTGHVPMTMFGMGIGNPFQDSYGLSSGDSNDVTGVLAMSRVAVYPVDSRGLLVGSGVDAARGRAPRPRAMQRFDTGLTMDHESLDEVAEATGGKAYYNTNDLKRVIGEVIDNGSSYYAIAYGTTNTRWTGEFRKIRIAVDRPGVHLQYRRGYYAYDHEQQQAREVAVLENREAEMGSESLQLNGQAGGKGEPADPTGALVRARGGFVVAMGLGAVPPTEIVFSASLRPSGTTEKVKKGELLPKGNYLHAQWQRKPFRYYTILIRADANHIAMTRSADGVRHGKVLFAAVVYDAEGQPVNSFAKTESFDLGRDPYSELLVSGLPFRSEIAIPAKGNYFLRLGVHDLIGDHIGAVEIPVDQIKLGVAGEDLQAQ